MLQICITGIDNRSSCCAIGTSFVYEASNGQRRRHVVWLQSSSKLAAKVPGSESGLLFALASSWDYLGASSPCRTADAAWPIGDRRCSQTSLSRCHTSWTSSQALSDLIACITQQSGPVILFDGCS